MDDLLNSKEIIWTRRLKECMDKNNLTQDSFAEAIRKKYGLKKHLTKNC